MGLLALDVSQFGVVMSADSQPVELVDGAYRVLNSDGQLRAKPIIVRRGGGFVGLIGFVGRPRIDGMPTRSWLERASRQHASEGLATFCQSLARELSRQWHRQRLSSGLWIFVSGIDGAEIRFWYVNNIDGMDSRTGTYSNIGRTFKAVDDLDANYIPPLLAPGVTKHDVLRQRMFFFRNGVLRPSAFVFDAFGQVMSAIYVQQIPGFSPIRSLDDLAYFDRQRIEFVKRLYSTKHGISTAARSGIAGDVHVVGVTLTGNIQEYGKHRGQIKQL